MLTINLTSEGLSPGTPHPVLTICSQIPSGVSHSSASLLQNGRAQTYHLPSAFPVLELELESIHTPFQTLITYPTIHKLFPAAQIAGLLCSFPFLTDHNISLNT